jgi:hypothetical protein
LKHLIFSIAAAALLATSVPTSGCGYFLHPERRGNSTHADGGMVVLDLLWLLPGVVPGIVALVVDFSSGAVYLRR